VREARLHRKEFYRILDEVIPGGSCTDAKNDVSSQSIYLSRISMDGLKEMHEYSKDARMYRYLYCKPHETVKETEEYLKDMINQVGNEINSRTRMMWFTKLLKNNKIIGTTSLLNINYDMQRTEWSIGLDPDYWGEGLSLEALEVLKKYVFEGLHLNRIDGTTRHDNDAVKSLVLSVGARNEGIARQSYRDREGKFVDGWMYSILAEDYFKNFSCQSKTGDVLEYDKEWIANIISQVLSEPGIKTDDSIHTVKKWDSLSHINIVFEVEKKTGYTFSPGEIAQLTSVENYYNILHRTK
jgi:[ribosomal protein S5]-alanine N-acetyltransferase